MKRQKKQIQFPSRIAKGENFCDRNDERKRIRNNIENIQHTLLISPRRYGKTSLVLQAIHESRLPYASVQFFNAFQDEIVIKRFTEGLGQLLSKLVPKTKQALKRFAELVTHDILSVTFRDVNVEVGIKPLSKTPADIIKGLLMDIDQILKKKNTKAVIFFDEFQDIVESDSSDELQSVLRDFAQLTDHLTFIVSGSHRHMLTKIFDDSNKPFYKLFDRIDLQRIRREEYVSFLQKRAEDQWGQKLAEDVIDEVLQLTECHAYYVNRLCSKLWEQEKRPTFRDVHLLWSQLVEEEFGSIGNELTSLTKNQRIVVQAMSKYAIVEAPNSTKFLQDVRLSARSVTLAIEALQKYDYIERVPMGYRVVDPVLKHILRE
jgi:AAA+ ATPase superfamily predicted ATPase